MNSPTPADNMSTLPDILRPLYEQRDGGLASSGALWVFGSSDVLSRTYAEGVPPTLLPFASDVFGDLFAVDGNAIVRFETETGSVEPFASTLDDWQHAVMAVPENIGVDVCKAWVAAHGPLPDGTRLVPGIPFVLGGKADIDRLKAIPLAEILGARHVLAEQLQGLPDGSRVSLLAGD